MFLRPLLAALNSRPSREEFTARCAAIAFALPRIPTSLLTPWRQREALARFKFLPSPAEISEWLVPDLRDERERADQTERLSLPAPQSERVTRTAEEIAEVRAKIAAFEAEVRANEVANASRPKVSPCYLSERALLAHYEASAKMGNRAAAFRAEQLRKRVGPDDHRDPYEAQPHECDA